MESLGNTLKNSRKERGLTFDQVSRETNITLRYLEALETENFDVFPGEPYVIGFIKNYGSYLELDVQRLISLYKALKIQEQPIPVEQLLKPKREFPKFILPTLGIIAVTCAVGWGIYHFVSTRQVRQTQNSPENRSPVEYVMEGHSMERRFYRNDSILIPAGDDLYKLELTNLGDAVTIRTPSGSVVLDLSQEVNVDLSNNGIPELRLTLVDFAKNRADMGALIHFYLLDAVAQFDAAVEAELSTPSTAGVAGAASAVVATIIPSSPSAYPFTLQAGFQGYCMFRWEVLNERDRRERNQRYFQRGDEVRVQAQNGIRFWASNAQSARFQVIGGGRTFPVDIGSPGEVVVADIRWVRDDDNRYRLILIRLEPTPN